MVLNVLRAAMTVLTVTTIPSLAFAQDAPRYVSRWPDTPVMRVEALAVLQTLNSELLSHDSATLTLDRWCAAHGLAKDAKIIAERVKVEEKPATPEIRSLLKAAEPEPLAYRSVRLKCGDRVLSEADNWYVPARLTQEMNKTLNTSDSAFGRVVQPLQFQRHTLSAELLWHPLPQGWEVGQGPVERASEGMLEIPAYVLRHRAFLSKPDGMPFSLVVETYRRDLLDFEPPKLDTVK